MLNLTADELHALMGLVRDKITKLTPGNERSAAFYAKLDRKLTDANYRRIVRKVTT